MCESASVLFSVSDIFTVFACSLTWCLVWADIFYIVEIILDGEIFTSKGHLPPPPAASGRHRSTCAAKVVL